MAVPTPRVFHDVPLDQNPFRILEFKQILDDEFLADEIRSTRLPAEGLEEVVAANFDVRGDLRSRCPAKQHVFRRRLEIIVHNLVDAHRNRTVPANDGLRVNARTGYCDAVEIVEV